VGAEGRLRFAQPLELKPHQALRVALVHRAQVHALRGRFAPAGDMRPFSVRVYCPSGFPGPAMGTASDVGLLTGVLSLAREPARLTLRIWELGLSGAASAARLGLELLDPGRSGSTPTERYQRPPSSFGNGGPPDVVEAEPPVRPVRPAPPAADTPPAVPDELIPDHVDEEIVLVAEVAEEGAEDGAGPELHIDPPWDGYDQMTAPEIRDRLTGAGAAMAGAVELYEATHKGRATVLEAAARALKSQA
jgi:hypothetical protein